MQIPSRYNQQQKVRILEIQWTVIKIKAFVCLGCSHNLEQQHQTSANYFKRLCHMCWGLLSFVFREVYAPWTENSWCSKNTAFWVLMYFFTGLPDNLYLWLSFMKWQYGWGQVNSLLNSEQINQGSPSTFLKHWVWSLIFQNNLYIYMLPIIHLKWQAKAPKQK